jgi:hypothetical protein
VRQQFEGAIVDGNSHHCTGAVMLIEKAVFITVDTGW